MKCAVQVAFFEISQMNRVRLELRGICVYNWPIIILDEQCLKPIGRICLTSPPDDFLSEGRYIFDYNVFYLLC